MKITVCPAMFAEGYVPLQYAGGIEQVSETVPSYGRDKSEGRKVIRPFAKWVNRGKCFT